MSHKNTILQLSTPYADSEPSYSPPPLALITIQVRGFCSAGPATWNSLPDELHRITDTDLLKRRLKTELFLRTYCR